MRVQLDLKKEHRKELWAAISSFIILILTVWFSISH